MLACAQQPCSRHRLAWRGTATDCARRFDLDCCCFWIGRLMLNGDRSTFPGKEPDLTCEEELERVRDGALSSAVVAQSD